MKKVLFVMLVLMMTACTEKTMTRNFGGSETIELPKGERLIEITWKKSNMWILTEPMDSGYIPKTKKFFEDSEFGTWEGVVTIIESR